MLRSQSDFSARNHPIDQSFRPFEPTKRVHRPFYVPELANDMEKVFSEYDWKNHKFTSTLGPIPQSRPAPRGAASKSTKVSKKEDRRNTGAADDQASNSRSPFLPTHISRGAVDESITSSYLLSSTSSPSSASAATKTEWERSPCYNSSPISQNDTEHSPLQQSIMANADPDHQFRLPSGYTHSFEKRQETQHQHLQYSSSRIRPQTRRVTIDEHSSVRNQQKETTITGRTRSSTWSSDVPTVGGGSDDYTSTQKGKLPLFPCEPPSNDVWRGSIRRRRQTLIRSHSAFARLDHARDSGFGLEEEEEEEEEEDSAEENSDSRRNETRLSGIFSAIHYQYVSVGLRIQLAVHRTEKKVSRRLSNKRKSRHSDFL